MSVPDETAQEEMTPGAIMEIALQALLSVAEAHGMGNRRAVHLYEELSDYLFERDVVNEHSVTYFLELVSALDRFRPRPEKGKLKS